ncbi:MAG: domain S-box protein [Flavipsychrobacter sp.]|nr:domain S-box protein [Flavipsychrobacter sp.]
MKTTDLKPMLIIRLWHNYKSFVTNATQGGTQYGEDISYWREKLFTSFITYLLPTCFIALIPGVYMSFTQGLLFVACSDIIVVASIAIISLSRKLSLTFRKGFVAIILYCLSIMLIINLSLLGPGLIYLLALSVVITVTCPAFWGYWTIAMNFLVCIACAIIIHLRLFDSPLINDYGLGAWIAVSSNLLFLSMVIVILVNNTIDGLEKMIQKELLLKSELQVKSIEEEKSNKLLKESEDQYKKLFLQNPSPMWVLDNESLQFIQVNEAAIRVYGYSNEEFLSMNIKDIKLEKDFEKLYTDVSRNRKTAVSLEIFTQHRRKNGELFYAEVIFNSISFKGKLAILVISQDVTEQMDYINAIEMQNRQLKEIADIQSHKVRGPLATILGLVQLFEDSDTAIQTAEIINGISVSSIKLDKVICEIINKANLADVNIPNRIH